MAEEKKDIAVREVSTMMERPSFITGGNEGTQHIKKEDLMMPRLALAQDLSPETKKIEVTKYIDGLKSGDFFNNVTKTVYGTGPLRFMVVRGDRPRFVEFFDRNSNEGKGVKRMNVPANDPATRFGANGEKPTATKFYDFIIVLLPSREVIALSFKSSGLKIARELNAMIKMRNAPVYTGIYELRSEETKNDKGIFHVPQVKNAGWPTNDAAGEELVAYTKMLYEGLKDADVNISREGEHSDDDAEFAYGANAGEGATADEM